YLTQRRRFGTQQQRCGQFLPSAYLLGPRRPRSFGCTSMKRLLTLLAAFACCALPLLAQEAEHAAEHGGASTFLFEIVTILIAAKIGGELFERMNQPAVLGELIFGVALGNLSLLGVTFMQGFKTDDALVLA